MDVEELYRRYAAGERDFSGVDLSHADLNIDKVGYPEELEPGKNDLSGINLSGANLTGARLICVNLSGANLSSANLESATLECTILTGANLSDAILDYAELACDLIDVDLREASIFCTRLVGTDLSRANLMGATFQVHVKGYLVFSETIMPDGTINNEDEDHG
ncbi:pentapeptide repeat-containing protein [Tychonema sp. LEGE 07203]|uniref:pentapeptide repeat-containing protein n=1 Tax=Tychonema sp. LEGE 07203 TaxID=1828671 RepID=UPI00187E79F7|nr:pentapeptide repeat-containing protein [Tychonema sp. LEGE 07203]MBE9094428.1 pentapeptide repeat-containing protein [Tychonema sp. LEGE 07203]